MRKGDHIPLGPPPKLLEIQFRTTFHFTTFHKSLEILDIKCSLINRHTHTHTHAHTHTHTHTHTHSQWMNQRRSQFAYKSAMDTHPLSHNHKRNLRTQSQS